MNEKRRTPLDENALIAVWAICNGERRKIADDLLHGRVAFSGVTAPMFPKSLIEQVEALSSVKISNALSNEGVDSKKLRAFLHDYLVDFREGNIDWSQLGVNTLSWQEQEQGTLHVLHRLKKRFGEKFVISYRDCSDLEAGSHPVETLLIFDEDGSVCIEKLLHKNVDLGDSVDFVVRAINLPPIVELGEPQSTKRKGGGRPFALKYENGRFWYRGKDHIVRKSADYASLCDFVYTNCPTSDKKVHWREVFAHVYKRPSSSEIEDREKVRDLVKILNRWSGGKKVGLGQLLRLREDYIERLK